MSLPEEEKTVPKAKWTIDLQGLKANNCVRTEVGQFHEGGTHQEARCPWKTCIFFKMKMYGLLVCPGSSLGKAK